MTLEMQTALERELKDAKTPDDRALAQSAKGTVRESPLQSHCRGLSLFS